MAAAGMHTQACRPLHNTHMKIVLPALQCSRPYLEGVLPRPAAKSAAAALLSKCDSTERSDSSSDDEEGQDLCNCEFSLAYGAHTRQLRMCRVSVASISQDLCICEFSLACSAQRPPAAHRTVRRKCTPALFLFGQGSRIGEVC